MVRVVAKQSTFHGFLTLVEELAEEKLNTLFSADVVASAVALVLGMRETMELGMHRRSTGVRALLILG